MNDTKEILFTSESVTEGHPDKVADAVSDAVLDAMLAQDPMSRVACETLLTTGLCIVAGEITSDAQVDVSLVARETIADIGYIGGPTGFDGRRCAVLVTLDKQSPDISMGVSETASHEQGAGDQGMMFGYACDETPELMPLPISVAHKLGMQLSKLRRDRTLPWLLPDGKTQVTVRYVGGVPASIDTIVVSNQHLEEVGQDEIRREIIEKVCKPVIPAKMLSREIKYHVNPTGRFVLGGPVADSGLTGRKIIVDTYGGMGRHGGGAFSGKDPSKVDRSASYMARYMAKNVVAAGLAKRCEVQLAYAIGVAQPVSINVGAFGTGKIDEETLSALLRDTFDCRPASIIRELDLRKPIYRRTAAYGHFGRENEGFRWEERDKADTLRRKAGL